MKSESQKDLIRNFILTNLVKESEHKNLADSDNLIMEGIIDSLGLMKLITYLEEKFLIKLDDEDLTPDNFESIEIISSFIGKLIEVEK